MFRNPESNIGRVNRPPTQTGQELAVRSVYAQRNDCTRLTTDSFALPNFTCTIPKEVLFQVLNKLCNTAKTNFVIKQILDAFVNKLLAGKYTFQSKGEPPDHTFEQGYFLRILLAHDRTISGSNRNPKPQSRTHEQGDPGTQLCEIDGFNLPTLFGESEDLTNYEFYIDDFKCSDLFNENGEVYADPLWSSGDHGAMTVRDGHGCLMFLFDVYTVSTLSSLFGPLTVMSAPPTHHQGARPKTKRSTVNVSFACVACKFSDFKTTHSLRRHMIRVHNLACDTLVQGRPFPYVGYAMRRPNARELYDFPQLVFPDGWAVSHREDIDPEAASDRPPFGHRFVGVWSNIKCVPITNVDGTDNVFGRNRTILVDTVAVHKTDKLIDRHVQMMSAGSIGQKRQRESPGFDKNKEFREWIASRCDWRPRSKRLTILQESNI